MGLRLIALRVCIIRWPCKRALALSVELEEIKKNSCKRERVRYTVFCSVRRPGLNLFCTLGKLAKLRPSFIIHLFDLFDNPTLNFYS